MSSDESPPDESPPEASPPDESPPEASAPEASAPEPSAPEPSAPEPTAPATPQPEPPPPEPSAPATPQPEPPPPEPSPPEASPPEAALPPATPPPAALPPDDVVRDERPPRARGTGLLRLLAFAVMVGGLILVGAGAFTWFVVRDQLSDEKITVSDDADHFAGDPVDGPLTAYSEADVINEHALEATDGLTYAQLDQDDPRRETVMTASFLRASLFTSVVSFGVAAFAFGLGLLLLLIGWALLRIERSLRAMTT
jgi:hypothetical protein